MTRMLAQRGASLTAVHRLDLVEEFLFSEFRRKHVDLSDDDMRLGRAIRDAVLRECENASGADGYPLLLSGNSFGGGSFARKTHAAPLSDVDVFLVMNSGGLSIIQNGEQNPLQGLTRNPLSEDWTLKDGPWVSAHLVVARLAEMIGGLPFVSRHAVSHGMNDSGKSVFIKLNRDINVDISPVTWQLGRNRIDQYHMPAGRASTWWKATNPKEDQRRLTQQNQGQGKLLLPTIRVLKWWNKNRNSDRLKGIHLEVLAEKALLPFRLDGVAQAVHIAFEFLPTQLRSGCPDPTGLGQALDTNLTLSDRGESIVAAGNAQIWARAAAAAISRGDTVGAIQSWRNVLPL